MVAFADTAQSLIAGVRVLLRRPSELKLHDDDILEVLNDLCKEYVEEESLSIREHSTKVSPLTLTIPDDDTDADFNISDFEVPDFKAERLEYANAIGEAFVWREATIVPLEAWARHYSQGYVAASFYGSSQESTPAKLKLAFLDSQLENWQFRLTYRLPLLTVVQLGDKPPIPSAHLPMLKREAAILCAPLLDDDSPEWIAWMDRNLPLYVAKLQNLKKNWRNYLESSVEPQVQPIVRTDRAALRGARVSARPWIPNQ